MLGCFLLPRSERQSCFLSGLAVVFGYVKAFLWPWCLDWRRHTVRRPTDYKKKKKKKKKKSPFGAFWFKQSTIKAVNNQSFLSLMSMSLSYWLFLHVQVCNFTRHLFLKRLLVGPERIQSCQVFCRSNEATDNEVKSHPVTVAYTLRQTHVT